jgi:hypothetical protein
MIQNSSRNKTARIAGLLYLIVVLAGMFSLMYVPSKLIDDDNAAATFHHIASSELLFRLGIFSSLICYIVFVFLPVVLYKLLRPVNEDHARLMVILAVVSVPISFINMQNQFTVLSLVNTPAYLSGFSPEQLEAQVLFYLDQYSSGILLVSVFWGLWLFPFGYLVYKSGFLPKVFGILLMLGCLGYLINFTGNILIENYSAIGISKFISLPSALGEIGICLWLLLVGVKDKKITEN